MPLIVKRAALVATLGLLGAAALANDLTPAEARGKHIYTKGESTSSRIITAAMSTAASPTSASILPCIQCHGIDGRGIGIISPDINWEVLVDPAGHEHLARKHGPFDEASLAIAIRDGVDPEGNSLEATMPRYKIADPDMADLIAYLKRIDAELDPGISADRIRIGTVLPTKGPMGGAGVAMRQLIEAYFNFVNATGGVHGRDLELIAAEFGDDQSPPFWALQDLVRESPPFAMIATYLPGFDAELSTLVEEQQMPLVGPYTLLGTERASRYEFFLQARLAEQAAALVQAVTSQAVAAQAEPPQLAVVHPASAGFDAVAKLVRERVAEAGNGRTMILPYVPGGFDATAISSKLRESDIDAVVFLGAADDFAAFGKEAGATDWKPTLLAPGILAERGVFDLPESFGGQVFLSYASLPDDYTHEGGNLFEALHRDAALGYDYSVAQIAAFTAVSVLVEALERAGPMPSRERLVSALESLDAYAPGLSARVSFGPDRRVGPGGAWVVRVDLIERRLDTDRRWIEVD